VRRDDRASLKRTSPQPGIGLRRVLEGEVLGVSLDPAGACKLENLRKLLVADSYRPNGRPTTGYRNLESFAMYARLRTDPQNEDVRARLGSPLSFWIRAVEWDEEKLVDLAHHLNFFMRYFDHDSSQIVLNEPSAAQTDFAQVTMPHGPFPGEINAHRLDSNLLTVWRGAAASTDVFLGFLLYYQVLEYAANYFLDDKTRKGVERILRAPDVGARAGASAQRVVDLVSAASSAPPDKRMDDVLRELVEPDLLWAIIEPNKSFFARTCRFTGGVSVEPLVGDDTTVETYRAKWPGKVGRTLRQVRNAVAHPGDPGGSGTIESCDANKTCLEPWLLLAKAAASQVVLHFPE